MSDLGGRHSAMDQLIERAGALGLRVIFRDLGRRYGELHSSGLIYINHRKTHDRQRVTLAHELGHWVMSHDWRREHDRARDELEADQYASRLLITLDDYARAEDLVGCHPGALAAELGVTRRIVELRQRDFARDLRIFTTVDEWRTA